MVGYYCVASTSQTRTLRPEPCPVGTYGNAPGLTAESECELCDEGAYCATAGLYYLTHHSICYLIGLVVLLLTSSSYVLSSISSVPIFYKYKTVAKVIASTSLVKSGFKLKPSTCWSVD